MCHFVKIISPTGPEKEIPNEDVGRKSHHFSSFKKERNWMNVAPHKWMAEAELGFCMIIVIQHHPTATPLDHDYLVIT